MSVIKLPYKKIIFYLIIKKNKSIFLFLLAAEEFHVLMESLTVNNLFSGYQIVRSDPVVVSHLQFADDALILGEKSWANVRGMRVVLLLFESLSGLKVNISKSQLVGVNVEGSWLAEAARVLQCRVGSLPCIWGCLLVVMRFGNL